MFCSRCVNLRLLVTQSPSIELLMRCMASRLCREKPIRRIDSVTSFAPWCCCCCCFFFTFESSQVPLSVNFFFFIIIRPPPIHSPAHFCYFKNIQWINGRRISSFIKVQRNEDEENGEKESFSRERVLSSSLSPLYRRGRRRGGRRRRRSIEFLFAISTHALLVIVCTRRDFLSENRRKQRKKINLSFRLVDRFTFWWEVERKRRLLRCFIISRGRKKNGFNMVFSLNYASTTIAPGK